MSKGTEETDKHNFILVISDTSDQIITLVKQFQTEGHCIYHMPPSENFNNLNTKNIISIWLINCRDTYAEIVNRLINIDREILKIPIINIRENDSSNISNIFKLIRVTLVEESNQYPTGFPKNIFQEKRQHDRRKFINLIEQTQISQKKQMDLPICSPEPPNLITLFVLSEQKQLADKLQAHIGYKSNLRIVDGFLTPSQCACDRLSRTAPDLILIDTTSANKTLDDYLSTIRKNDMTVKIILLSDLEMPNLSAAIIQFKIHGLIQLNASPDVYLKAINSVQKGDFWLPRSIIKQIFTYAYAQLSDSDSSPKLSPCEQMIAILVPQGKTNKQIALELSVSPETVKKHMKSIFNKLGIQRRSALTSKKYN